MDIISPVFMPCFLQLFIICFGLALFVHAGEGGDDGVCIGGAGVRTLMAFT